MSIRRFDSTIARAQTTAHADGAGAINLLAKSIRPLRRIEGPAAGVTQLPKTGDSPTAADDFAVVAPAAMNFGQGRRR